MLISYQWPHPQHIFMYLYMYTRTYTYVYIHILICSYIFVYRYDFVSNESLPEGMRWLIRKNLHDSFENLYMSECQNLVMTHLKICTWLMWKFADQSVTTERVMSRRKESCHVGTSHVTMNVSRHVWISQVTCKLDVAEVNRAWVGQKYLLFDPRSFQKKRMR